MWLRIHAGIKVRPYQQTKRAPDIFSKIWLYGGVGSTNGTIVFDNFCMTYDASWWWILTFVLLWELCTDTMFTEWLETFESGGKKIPITTSYLLQFSVTNNLVIRSCDNVSMDPKRRSCRPRGTAKRCNDVDPADSPLPRGRWLSLGVNFAMTVLLNSLSQSA